MKLCILISTIDEGITKVPQVLMPQHGDIRYVVSMQWTKQGAKELVPKVLREREDVTLTLLEGKGLSKNRNNAIEAAGESEDTVFLIADDDNRYDDEMIGNIFKAYEEHPEADVIHFQALNMEGKPLHPYPADYMSSIELTFRSTVKTQFDERFGLGSEWLCAGEESVWMKDTKDARYSVLYVAKPIVTTTAGTTGSRFVGYKRMQMSKGATFRYLFGTGEAMWRSVKEAGWWMVHRGANPLPILWNMFRGILLYT